MTITLSLVDMLILLVGIGLMLILIHALLMVQIRREVNAVEQAIYNDYADLYNSIQLGFEQLEIPKRDKREFVAQRERNREAARNNKRLIKEAKNRG